MSEVRSMEAGGVEGKIEPYPQEFLEHMVVARSQYDDTCRRLAGELIETRRLLSELRGMERGGAVNVVDAARAMCSICRGMTGFKSSVEKCPQFCQPSIYWHPYDEDYGKGWAACDASPIWKLMEEA